MQSGAGGYGIPAIDGLEGGMITSWCYILESHAHPLPDNTGVIFRSHSRTELSNNHFAGETQF